MRTLILAVCLSLPAIALAAGETIYVSDKLETQLRNGPSIQSKIVRIVHSGNPLTVIDEDKENGYTHVTTENGTEGWILTRHTTAQPLARAQLEGTNQKLESLTQESKQLHTEIDSLKKQLAEASSAKDGADNQAQKLAAELAQIRQASSSSVALLEERNQLLDKTTALETELDNLRREKDTLSEKNSQDWFMKGAGVLLGGLLLGVILPKLASPKRNSWDSF